MADQAHLASRPLVSNHHLSQAFLEIGTGLIAAGPVSLVAHLRRDVRVAAILGGRPRQSGAVGCDGLAGEIGSSLGSLARGDAPHGYLNVAWRQDDLGWGVSQHIVSPDGVTESPLAAVGVNGVGTGSPPGVTWRLMVMGGSCRARTAPACSGTERGGAGRGGAGWRANGVGKENPIFRNVIACGRGTCASWHVPALQVTFGQRKVPTPAKRYLYALRP
jgi:hypothetical protein